MKRQIQLIPQELQQEPVKEMEEPSASDEQEVEAAPDALAIESEQLSEQVAEEEIPELVACRTRQQSGKSILRPSKYSMATKLDKQTETDPKKLEAIKKGDREEIVQIFLGLKAVETVYEEDVEGKAHGCHIFTVDKFLANGKFDKCKSIIVLHGNGQNRNLYSDKSSPTVTIHSIFVCLAVATLHGITEVAKIDVKGAFIQTQWKAHRFTCGVILILLG